MALPINRVIVGDPYFSDTIRTFLKDAGLPARVPSGPATIVSPLTLQSLTELEPSLRAAQNLNGTADATQVLVNTDLKISHTIEALGPTNALASSLDMPSEAQAQVLEDICIAINSSDSRPGIPYSAQPRAFIRPISKFQVESPLRRAIQHLVQNFMLRSRSRKVRFGKHDADFGFYLLSIGGKGSIVKHFSDAFNNRNGLKLPIEIESVITETIRVFPMLPTGKDALGERSIRAFVLGQPSIACCLPLLGGQTQCLRRQKLRIPVPAYQALQHCGNLKLLENVYKGIMARLRSEFHHFQCHDTLYALGIFCTMISLYEYYEMGNRQHHIATRRQLKESLHRHLSLMNGFSAHQPPMRGCVRSQPVTELCSSVFIHEVPSSQQGTASESPQAQAGRADRGLDSTSNIPFESTWKARRLPIGSSQTCPASFKRTEKEVLDHLRTLEASAKSEADRTTIGRSIYKDATVLSSTSISSQLGRG